jgi:hypothetical protein
MLLTDVPSQFRKRFQYQPPLRLRDFWSLIILPSVYFRSFKSYIWCKLFEEYNTTFYHNFEFKLSLCRVLCNTKLHLYATLHSAKRTSNFFLAKPFLYKISAVPVICVSVLNLDSCRCKERRIRCEILTDGREIRGLSLQGTTPTITTEAQDLAIISKRRKLPSSWILYDHLLFCQITFLLPFGIIQPRTWKCLYRSIVINSPRF